MKLVLVCMPVTLDTALLHWDAVPCVYFSYGKLSLSCYCEPGSTSEWRASLILPWPLTVSLFAVEAP